MKTLKQTGFVQDEDIVKFPHGAIQNKTDLQPGTPVVREVYNDLLQNIYKLLDITGVVANGTEDSETSQHQIIDALKKFSNELNDLQQVVTLNANEWSVNFNIDLLPDNYVFIGKVSDNYVSGTSYTFKGTGVNSYSMISDSGFNASDLVLVIINQSQVVFLNLSSITGGNEVVTSFGTPLTFNDGNEVHYLSDGYISTNKPSVSNVQQHIRVLASNANLIVTDAIILKGKLLCFVFDTSALEYFFYDFDINDLTTPNLVTNDPFISGVDNQPYIYSDGTFVYMTNGDNGTVNDYDIKKYSYDENTSTLTGVTSFQIENTFEKTTNAFITGDFLFTFTSGNLYKYDLTSNSKVFVDFYNNINGVVFKQNGNTYYSNGEIAIKWVL